MQAAQTGRVVLVGSRVSRGIAGRSQYAATKAALASLARSWAAESIRAGVTVNVVSPAATDTPMIAKPLADPVHRARIGAGEDEGIGNAALSHHRPHLVHHVGRGHDLLAGHMPAALRPTLVFDHQGGYAESFIRMHRMNGVLHIPVAIVHVDQGWHRASVQDVGDTGANLGQTFEADVRNAITRSDQGKAADEEGLESGTPGDRGRQSVENTRKHQALASGDHGAQGSTPGQRPAVPCKPTRESAMEV